MEPLFGLLIRPVCYLLPLFLGGNVDLHRADDQTQGIQKRIEFQFFGACFSGFSDYWVDADVCSWTYDEGSSTSLTGIETFPSLSPPKPYARTDKRHGKFRSFLLASVKNFLSDNWDRGRAVKRGGDFEFVSLDQETAESFYDAASAADSTAESLFDVRWAKTLTSGALNSLRWELHAEGKTEIFEQLKSFLIGGSVLPSYGEASTRTGLPAATVKTHVHRLRLRYRELVRREVARTVSGPHQVDEELHYLCSVLADAA